MSKQYWDCKAAGICYKCRAAPIWGTHSTCDACAKVLREKQQARVTQARSADKCVKCFDAPQLPDNRLCAGCLTRTKRLQNPETREEEITQRPLRKYRKKHEGSGFPRRRGPDQGRLL
jgi:hypothetical protein